MCEELMPLKAELSQINEELEDCASDCDALPVPIPRMIKVPGPGELHSDLPDEYLCLDSDTKQDGVSIHIEHKMLSKAKYSAEFNAPSSNSSQHTCDTHSLSNTELSTVSTHKFLQGFTGYADQCHVNNESTEPVILDSKVKINQETPVTIAIGNTIGTVHSRTFLKVLLDSGLMVTLINKRALPKEVQAKN